MPAEDPKTKAQTLLDSLPGSTLLTKAAMLSSVAGLSVFAISNEYYVVNEETVVAVALLSMWAGAIKFGGPMYSAWADGHIARMKGILDQARADHKSAVQSRIDTVKEMVGVVDITKALFEVSKVHALCAQKIASSMHLLGLRVDGQLLTDMINRQETAQLEAKAYELEQKTAIAAEAKAVLDSWARYESQVKIKQQRELAENVIARVRKELENPKTLQQILQQSVADVESESTNQPAPSPWQGQKLTAHIRDHLEQGAIEAVTWSAERRTSAGSA